jgi:hypothetical protein
VVRAGRARVARRDAAARRGARDRARETGEKPRDAHLLSFLLYAADPISLPSAPGVGPREGGPPSPLLGSLRSAAAEPLLCRCSATPACACAIAAIAGLANGVGIAPFCMKFCMKCAIAAASAAGSFAAPGAAPGATALAPEKFGGNATPPAAFASGAPGIGAPAALNAPGVGAVAALPSGCPAAFAPSAGGGGAMTRDSARAWCVLDRAKKAQKTLNGAKMRRERFWRAMVSYRTLCRTSKQSEHDYFWGVRTSRRDLHVARNIHFMRESA